MAKLVQIRSLKKSRANQSAKVGIGDKMIPILYNEDCIAEVPEDILVELLQTDLSLEVLDKEILASLRSKEEVSSDEIITLTRENSSLKGGISTLKSANEKLVAENEVLKTQIIELGLEPAKSDKENGISKYELQKMKVRELQEIAEEAKLPKEEWIGLLKEKLINYLLDKLNDSK